MLPRILDQPRSSLVKRIRNNILSKKKDTLNKRDDKAS